MLQPGLMLNSVKLLVTQMGQMLAIGLILSSAKLLAVLVQSVSKVPKFFHHPDNQNQFQHMIFFGIEGYRFEQRAVICSLAQRFGANDSRQNVEDFVTTPLITLINLPLLIDTFNQDRRVFLNLIVLVVSANVYTCEKCKKNCFLLIRTHRLNLFQGFSSILKVLQRPCPPRARLLFLLFLLFCLIVLYLSLSSV